VTLKHELEGFTIVLLVEYMATVAAAVAASVAATVPMECCNFINHSLLIITKSHNTAGSCDRDCSTKSGGWRANWNDLRPTLVVLDLNLKLVYYSRWLK